MSVATTCPYCGVGCGVRVRRTAAGVSVAGDPDHPANRGRLCAKGAALGETLGLEDRLRHPEIRGQRVSWNAALAAVADGLQAVRAAHGPQAIAFYVSGQLLTEDYYVANKLMKGFLGAANIDTNSRLCMASAVAGHQRAFGADAVPCDYADVEAADLIVIVGSNTAWCHPVLYNRIERAKADRPGVKIVTIDPRRTVTSEIADLHLALAPGTDAVLYSGLLGYLGATDRLDLGFLERHVEDHADALAAARAAAPSIPTVARACGLKEREVARFYRMYARTERVVTLFSQGINQSSSGTDRVNSIINCHLATGRIGKPGAGPFSITGQPNAMGGREVGGLATQLAAHMGFTPESLERVARFWGSGSVAPAPGLKAVDMFEAVERGDIRALWIMATNPAVSLPDADRFRAALARCELVIVSDCVRHTDTTAHAHILLPAAAWGEKSGTVTNSERCISRSRAFLAPPGEARPDWWIITQVARRLGFADRFPYRTPADVFREHARLSGFENDGGRAFDIGALAELTDAEYDALAPLQWPVPSRGRAAGARLYADGRFYHPSGKARMIAVTPRPPANPPGGAYPLVLNSGRVRDQWHTMTRSARSARLLAHIAEPYVEIHPEDAQRYGIVAGDLARLISPYGEMLARVRSSAAQRRGSVFVPIHWSDAFARRARAGALANPATDPVSGQPEFKHTPVRVETYRAGWHAFLLRRRPLAPAAADYCVSIKVDGGWRYELAGAEAPAAWPQLAREWLGDEGEWLEFEDRGRGRYRAARVVDDGLAACLFAGPTHELPPRGWLQSLLARPRLTPAERRGLLAGRPGTGAYDNDMVCACFNLGRERVLAAIRNERLDTVEGIGARFGAGTSCGSCVPELRALINAAAAARAPATPVAPT